MVTQKDIHAAEEILSKKKAKNVDLKQLLTKVRLLGIKIKETQDNQKDITLLDINDK